MLISGDHKLQICPVVGDGYYVIRVESERLDGRLMVSSVLDIPYPPSSHSKYLSVLFHLPQQSTDVDCQLMGGLWQGWAGHGESDIVFCLPNLISNLGWSHVPRVKRLDFFSISGFPPMTAKHGLASMFGCM